MSTEVDEEEFVSAAIYAGVPVGHAKSWYAGQSSSQIKTSADRLVDRCLTEVAESHLPDSQY